MSDKPRIAIEYCTQCRFVLRASWLAQELLFTFADDLAEVALRPSTGGVFRVLLDEQPLFDRADHHRFPDSKELKQLVRDRIDPTRDLGHSDRGA
ncbi:SelT/SelW/SelH family protein [uncultured Abyssibacter sp.]|uniref:SelT/SelW/SelH family protein n=1 Tax=uncultured Abyssibacter sp. TaxID=2320202 RepID=UPI0032B12211|tara:strand:+ start:278 stop:562 length:285 start_codon:yes stop_codon:yes gene_type:complete